MKTVLVKPLANKIIRHDPLSDDENAICLDKLNPDLSFKKELARTKAKDLHIAKRQFFLKGKAKAGGWIEVEEKYTTQEMIKDAMKKLRERVQSKAS